MVSDGGLFDRIVTKTGNTPFGEQEGVKNVSKELGGWDGMSAKQLRFLQAFLRSGDVVPDVSACLNEAGYRDSTSASALRGARRIIERVSKQGQQNFQLLLNQAVTDIDMVTKLRGLMACEQPAVALSALKTALELKGYNESSEQAAGSIIQINVVGDVGADLPDNAQGEIISLGIDASKNNDL